MQSMLFTLGLVGGSPDCSAFVRTLHWEMRSLHSAIMLRGNRIQPLSQLHCYGQMVS